MGLLSAAMPDATAARVVRFGDIEARLDSGEMPRAGRRQVPPDQPLRILIRLLERPGDLATQG